MRIAGITRMGLGSSRRLEPTNGWVDDRILLTKPKILKNVEKTTSAYSFPSKQIETIPYPFCLLSSFLIACRQLITSI